MRKWWLLAWLCMAWGVISAQNNVSWTTYLNELTDIEQAESEAWEQGYEVLDELSQNPINLNHATRYDLEQLFFLTDSQIEELVEYIDKHAPLRSLGELSMIESLDFQRRQLLLCFVSIDNHTEKQAFPSFKNALKDGKHEWLTTFKMPFYQRKGDDNGYLGYPYKHWTKYTFQYHNQIKAGLVASQDAGEPWFAGRNKQGYDYYSYYFQLKNMGALRNMVVGRYRIKLGLGLVINRDFGLGKLATLASLSNQTNVIRAHSSRSEANYLQGLAATIGLSRDVNLTGFASYRAIDGTLAKDSTHISTIIETGYHRTPTEMAHKHNTDQWLLGAHLGYAKHGFRLGFTALTAGLSQPLQPDTTTLFRKYHASGSSFWNTSIHYGYINGKLSVQGETATGDSKALATLNTIHFRATSNLALIAIQRFYSYRYYSIFAQSFSESGNIQNESGLYLGAQWLPLPRLTLSTYIDYAYFPWATYRASHTNDAWDSFLQAQYHIGKWDMMAHYRLRIQEKDGEDNLSLIPQYTHRFRISAAQTQGFWYTKAQIDAAYHKALKRSIGTMFTLQAGYQRGNLKTFANIGYFHTDDYNSRLYTYERGTLYSFAFPMFMGEGIRAAINARYDIHKQMMVMLKLGTTRYFDRNKIGTSYQTINSNTQTDLELQLRWRF